MVKSPAQLADILRITPEQLKWLIEAKENYIRFPEKRSGRKIQEPKPLLKKTHSRVAALLGRVKTPDFLHSAVKGRSYLTNAMEHGSGQPTVRIDIRKFFQSVRAPAVFHFFRDTMSCPADVAGTLTTLMTVDGHLPTGGNASTVLSYFTYSEMFEQIDDLARSRGCTMTCYVDDMVFTGAGATRRLINDVRVIAKGYRLWVHKTKIFRAGQPKVVTGVAITAKGRRLPNRRQKAIADDLALLDTTGGISEKLVIARRLTGRMYEAAQIDPGWMKKAEEMKARSRGLERSIPST